MVPFAGSAAGFEATIVLSMKLITCLALFLCICSGWALAQPILEPICDARLVAEHMKGMTQAQFEEVVFELHKMNAIDDSYAAELLEFIKQAYSAPDVGAWVRSRCAPQSRTENRSVAPLYVKR